MGICIIPKNSGYCAPENKKPDPRAIQKVSIISKNAKGDPEIFELELIVNFKVLSDGKLLIDKQIKRRNTYDNISDKFQLEQDEEVIIEKKPDKIFLYF